MTDTTQTHEAAASEEDKRFRGIWRLRCAVLNRAWVEVRYHHRRQRFFDLATRLNRFLCLVLGASLTVDSFVEWVPWQASAITFLGLLASQFDCSVRMQLHRDLAKRAGELVADIELVTVDGLSFDKTAVWASKYARLVANSPPPLKTLTMLCEREQAASE